MPHPPATPPHDLDAELSVIGSMLLSRDAIIEARQILSAEDFYRGAHRTLFEAIVEMSRRGEPVDAVTLTDELERRGQLESVGGAGYVADVITLVPAAASCQFYARIVRDHAVRRATIDRAAAAAADAGNLTVPVADTLASLRDGLPSAAIRRLRALSLNDLMSLPAPQWLIETIVPTGFNVLYGPSSGGKTFVSLHMALSVATGTPWFGHKVLGGSKPDDAPDDWQPGLPVIYLAAEGAYRLPKRVDAWMTDTEREPRPDYFTLIPDPINLQDQADVDAVADLVGEKRAKLLVLDTWARVIGGDENSTQDSSTAIRHLDQIRAQYDVTILVVHHTGQSEQGRMRGNSSLFGAADAVIAVKPNGVDGIDLINQPAPVGKQKDAAPFPTMTLRRRDVIGRRTRESSCVLDSGAAGGNLTGWTMALIEDRIAADGPVTKWEIVAAAGGNEQAFERLVYEGKLVPVPYSSPTRYTLPHLLAKETGRPASPNGRRYTPL